MRKTIGPSRRLTVKIAAIAVTLTVVGLAGNGQTSAATATVNVGDFWFCNSTFSGSVCPTSIKTGDTVTWNWVGSASHTTTACSDGTFTTCGAAQGWDSGSMSTGTFSHTFNSAGPAAGSPSMPTAAARHHSSVVSPAVLTSLATTS